jgi:uncharacterized membrane protein
MWRNQLLLILILTIITGGAISITTNGYAQALVVRAVLFYAPSCEHCKIVIDEVLPQLKARYGNQLDIVGIDVNAGLGHLLYQNAITKFNIPNDRIGVPTLIVGDFVLVGGTEIPEKLPDIIQQGLASGGIDWPSIAGLAEVLAAQPSDTTSQLKPSDESVNDPGWTHRFLKDPLANSIAVAVLIVMLASVIGVVYTFLRSDESQIPKWSERMIPALALIGLGIAIYMTFIEVTNSKAICGPVGDCNSVQESPYAKLFGILPIGLFGAVGYGIILLTWVMRQKGPQTIRKWTPLGIWGMAWFGIIFSIYLTFLEPFVIGATCAWCISSAIIMTLIFWISTAPAKKVFQINDYDSLEELEIEIPSEENAEG